MKDSGTVRASILWHFLTHPTMISFEGREDPVKLNCGGSEVHCTLAKETLRLTFTGLERAATGLLIAAKLSVAGTAKPRDPIMITRLTIIAR